MLISKTEFARKLEVSKAYVSKLLKKNIITEENGLIDYEKALASIEKNSDPSRSYAKKKRTKIKEEINNLNIDEKQKELLSKNITSVQNFENLNYQEARTKSEQFKAALAQLELMQKKNQLLDAEMVKNEAFEIGKKARESLLSIPSRISDLLAVEKDSFKIQEMLYKEIEQSINDLIDNLKRELINKK